MCPRHPTESVCDRAKEALHKTTRRERFLAEMNAVIPWTRLLALIAPHYPKAGNGTQPIGLERMLRIYFLQQGFNLSDPAAEDVIYDSESMRRFAGIELGEDGFRMKPPSCASAISSNTTS